MLARIKLWVVGLVVGAAAILKLIFDRKKAEDELAEDRRKATQAENVYYRRKTRAEEVLERQQAEERKRRAKSFEDKKRDQLDNDW